MVNHQDGVARFLMTLPQDEMEQRARLLNQMARLLSLIAIVWGIVALFAPTQPTSFNDLAGNIFILLALFATAFLTFFCLARCEYHMASLIFVVGFALAVTIAVARFGRIVPEIHLFYLLPIALAATLWGSILGSFTAVGVWGANVSAVANQIITGPLPKTFEGTIGLLTLGVTYVAVALVVGRYAENLVGALHRAEEKARQAEAAESKAHNYAVELEDAYVQTVFALAKAVEAKDTYTADHAEQLADLAERVAKNLGVVDPDELRALRFGAMLHDVGKIGVPDSILKKPGPLTPDEWKVMRQHPVIGSRILGTVARLRSAAQVVRHHHERWDGKGYPDGLAGEAIPLSARILTVVDSYSAIVDARVYKAARNHSEAIDELVRSRGSQFDPTVVQAFFELTGENSDRAVTLRSTNEFPVPVAELEAINRLIGAVSGSLNLDEILRQAARTTVESLSAAACGIFLYDVATDTLNLAADYHLPESLKLRFAHFPVKGFHNEAVVREGCIRMHSSPARIPEFVKLGIPTLMPHWGAYLCVPLKSKGEVNGVMGIFSQQPRIFDSHDRALYQAIGEQIGSAIANARLHESVQRLALTDSLTGAYNRRYLTEFLGEELKQSADHHDISLIMLDLDEFKNYNDTFGHPAGDQVLRAFASILKDTLRSNDVVTRYGGDEFAIVLVDTDRSSAKFVAEKIRSAIERKEFPHGHITVSEGVATCAYNPATLPDALIALADQALYEAKRRGGNQIWMTETESVKEAV